MEKGSDKKNIIAAVLLLSLLLAGFGVFFYLKNQIKPEELKASIIQKLEETIPGADVSLGDLKVKYGTSFIIDIKGMDILLKESLVSKRDFLQVSHVKVKLPLLSLLTGGGNLEIYLKKPELFLYRPEGKKGNWNLALNAKPKPGQAINKKGAFKGSHNIILPAFLINSTAALRMTGVRVYYDISDKAGVWSASKIVLKNVGLNSNAAFEIESNFKRVLKEEEKFSFDTVLIGSIELERYLKTGTLKINSNYKIKNLKTRGLDSTFPLIRGNTSVDIERDGAIEGNFSILYQESELKASFKANKEANELNIDKSKIKASDLMAILPLWHKNFDLSQTSIQLEGKVTNTSDISFKPALKFTFSNLKLKNAKFPLSISLGGSFVEREIKTTFEGSIWQGTFDGKFEGDFDLQSDSSLDKRLSFYSGDLSLKNVNLPENILKSDPSEKESSNILLPKGIININYENLVIGKKQVNGGLTFKSEFSKLEIKNGVALLGQGKVSFESMAEVFEDNISWQHKISFSEIEGEQLYSLLPSEYPFFKGVLNGSLTGKFKDHPLNGEELNWQLKAKEGSFIAFDNNLINKALSQSLKSGYLSSLRKKDVELVKDQTFKDLSLVLSIKDDEHHLKSLSYVDSQGHDLKISGFIEPLTNAQKRLIVQVTGDDDFQKGLKKKTKMKAFPMSFYSEGYSFELDELYSLNQLAKKMRFKKDRKRIKNKILKVKAQKKRENNEKS